MEEEIKPKRHYKIEVGDKVKIKKQVFGEYVFYKTTVKTKNADGTEMMFDKNLFFPKGTDIPDGSTVILKDFFEDPRPIKNDRFNANWVLVIMDFEIIKNDENVFQDYNKANEEFDINNFGNDEIPF